MIFVEAFAKLMNPLRFLYYLPELKKLMVLGFEWIDDYITKPFSIRELKTRVDVFFRRWDKRIGIKT